MPKYYDPETDTNEQIICKAMLLGMELSENERGQYVVHPPYALSGSEGWVYKVNAARSFLRWKAGEPYTFGDFRREYIGGKLYG